MPDIIKYICTLAVLICILIPFNSNAQKVSIEYPYKHYTVHDGLVQMQVQTLFQDSKGYLWCGTKTGVSRFDGRNFKNYSSLDIKQTSPAVFIDEDTLGNLLIFNYKNISVLSDDSVRSLTYPKGYQLSEFDVKPCHHNSLPLCQITKNNSTNQNYLLRYKNLDSTFIEEFDLHYGGKILFNEKEPDLIWQIRHDSIFKVNIRNKTIADAYPHNNIETLNYLNNELYGFSYNNGIFKLVNNEFKNISKQQFSIGNLKVILSPNHKSLIISSSKNIYRFEHEKVETIKSELTLIRDITFDNEGNLWVATEEGLYNFFKLNFVNYTFGMGNKDWVWSIAEDPDNNMWFTSYQNGIWKWDGKTITNYTNFLNQQKIEKYNIHYDYSYFMGGSSSDNTVYFPTNYNILTYDGSNFASVNGITTTWNKAYFFSKTISNGTFYCGGMAGLFEKKVNGKIRTWPADSLKISTIVSAEIDKNNVITAIGSSGIAQINEDSITYFNQNKLLKNYCSVSDHKGNIWIGSSQELKLISNDSLKSVPQKNNDHYFSLLFIKPHYLFMGGINGLYLVNLDDYYNSNLFEPILFNQNNGFTGTECGQNGFYTDSEGYVWINTSDLVTRFNPHQLIAQKTSPPFIQLHTEMSVNNIKWIDVSKSDTQTYYFNHNNFRFQLNAVSFCNAENIRYYHKLEGLQSTWSPPSSNNEITFYNLNPGTYTLYIRADAGTSNASSEIVSYSFEIKKPYWQTWWFIICLIILFSGLMYVVVILFNRRARKEELIKKRIVQLRADALKSQMNPHLIYNALNNINGLINLGEKKKAQQYLNSFSDMLRLVFASTNKHEISLDNELEIVKSFILFHKHANAKDFEYKIDSKLSIDMANILIPPVLIQPFVENAILHGFSNLNGRLGLIQISTENRNGRLIISIEDNGVGMGKSEYKGNGRGTKLTHERMQLLEKKTDNQVKIINLEAGTQVVINIPLKLLK